MISIPKQLQRDEFRFYLVRRNDKRPAEPAWTTKNNYLYDDPHLLNSSGNYGVLCGEGNLIVLDFDCAKFHRTVQHLLPNTFKVITAGKRLPHYYYILTGTTEPLKKIPIDDFEGKRVCDVQTHKCGVVGPNSTCNRRYYEPNNHEITELSLENLKKIFGITEVEELKIFNGESKPSTKKMNVALAVLHVCGIRVKTDTNMKCPFHGMSGQGNLSITPAGKIYCFHCTNNWWPDQFIEQYFKVGRRTSKMMVKMVELLYQERKR